MFSHEAIGLDRLNRHRGCLLGRATGTLEFQRPGSFEPLHDVLRGGPFGLEPCQWRTGADDDGSVEKLIARTKHTFDPFQECPAGGEAAR
jgi:ADP-ribosyl-[dinitrogen reductase] hydrolase